MLVTRDGFGLDYPNHVWLVWAQGQSIGAHGFPAYFLNAPEAGGVFNPFFAFYGGTLYSAAGALSALLGDRAIVAYTLVSLVCVGGGLRGAGVARPPARGAHLDGARAGGLLRHQRLLRDGALRARRVVGVRRRLLAARCWPPPACGSPARTRFELGPCFALWVAAVWWSGSHNITLAWGSRRRSRCCSSPCSWRACGWRLGRVAVVLSGWACPSTPGSWCPTWCTRRRR